MKCFHVHRTRSIVMHDDVIKWKYFPRYWPCVRGIHRSPVNSPHKGQGRGALMFSLICVWINNWISNRDAGDLRRYRAHYDVIVMDNKKKPRRWLLMSILILCKDGTISLFLNLFLLLLLLLFVCCFRFQRQNITPNVIKDVNSLFKWEIILLPLIIRRSGNIPERFDTRGPFCKQKITEIRTWITNYICWFLRRVFTHPCYNFNGNWRLQATT